MRTARNGKASRGQCSDSGSKEQHGTLLPSSPNCCMRSLRLKAGSAANFLLLANLTWGSTSSIYPVELIRFACWLGCGRHRIGTITRDDCRGRRQSTRRKRDRRGGWTQLALQVHPIRNQIVSTTVLRRAMTKRQVLNVQALLHHCFDGGDTPCTQDRPYRSDGTERYGRCYDIR